MAVLPRLLIVFVVALAASVTIVLLRDATDWGPNAELVAMFIGVVLVGGTAQILGLMEPPDHRPF